MNIINSTANKVLELEKRLDNQLVDKTIKVSEIQRVVESVVSSETEFPVLTFNTTSDISVVVQGEVEVRTTGVTDLFITLVLDGFEVYSKKLAVSDGEHSISVMKAINLLGGTSESLVLRIKYLSSGELYFKGYNFFVWGYGESLGLGVSASEPKISATLKDGRYVICFALDDRAFILMKEEFPENLKFEDFSYFGEFNYLEPIYEGAELPGGEEQSLTLRLFAISKDKDLVMFTGDNLTGRVEDAEFIESDVVSVSATKVNKSDEIVVVYAVKSGEIKYFSIIDGTRSSIMTLTTMDEPVSEVSLVQNCETTTFLVVGLESGRSYLFSSVTSVSSADKLGRVAVSMEVEFP